MSWDAYIDNWLLQKRTETTKYDNCCSSCAILSKFDGSIWACSPNFRLLNYKLDIPDEDSKYSERVYINEAANLVYTMNHDGKSPNKAGIRITNKKYLVVRFDSEAKSMYLRGRLGGACACMTNLCIIFASYDDNSIVTSETEYPFVQNAGLTNERVESLADFLRESGF
ncbi:unnamed protein product [Blepharisma stoltei]|uniref:Profilin n=1 Tax=Blepharisma stoltei TaxID=1481888 RepID=A0AAU9KMR5_9CILI|nr:unnamed protein product [Blepharisma stoltei]